MKNGLEILLCLAMAGTLVVLSMGIFQLFRKDKSHQQKQHSNNLMRLRVLFQAIALGVLALLFLTRK